MKKEITEIFIKKKIKKIAAKKFGSKAGILMRQRYDKFHNEKYNKKHICLKCNKGVMKNLFSGLWICKKCKIKKVGSFINP